jgi:hypothetical protein
MKDITRRDFIKALVILGGVPAVLAVEIPSFGDWSDAPITPELPAGHVEIHGVVLGIHSMMVSGTRMEHGYDADGLRQYIMSPPQYELKFTTFDMWPGGPKNVPSGLKPSTIKIRPGDYDVVLTGQGRLVLVEYGVAASTPPLWNYRIIGTDTWQWGTG